MAGPPLLSAWPRLGEWLNPGQPEGTFGQLIHAESGVAALTLRCQAEGCTCTWAGKTRRQGLELPRPCSFSWAVGTGSFTRMPFCPLPSLGIQWQVRRVGSVVMAMVQPAGCSLPPPLPLPCTRDNSHSPGVSGALTPTFPAPVGSCVEDSRVQQTVSASGLLG